MHKTSDDSSPNILFNYSRDLNSGIVGIKWDSSLTEHSDIHLISNCNIELREQLIKHAFRKYCLIFQWLEDEIMNSAD